MLLPSSSGASAVPPQSTQDHVVSLPDQALPKSPPAHDYSWWHATRSVLIAVLIAVLFRSFVCEPYMIPTGSMRPTLAIGDYLFVNKFAYGYTRFSLPGSFPLWEGRVFARADPKRGDVVVLRATKNNDPKTYIKRVVGLPGDMIAVHGGVVYINGVAVPRQWIGEEPYHPEGLDAPDPASRDHAVIQRYIETLPNGVVHYSYDHRPDGRYDDTYPAMVPDGHYFLMGDNRDHSADSRSFLGFIPQDHIVGKAVFILFSTQATFWNPLSWFRDVNMKRFFRPIDRIHDHV